MSESLTAGKVLSTVPGMVDVVEMSEASAELARVRTATGIERQWWRGKYVLSLAGGLEARERGDLVEVRH